MGERGVEGGGSRVGLGCRRRAVQRGREHTTMRNRTGQSERRVERRGVVDRFGGAPVKVYRGVEALDL